jgi:hypothetical protein
MVGLTGVWCVDRVMYELKIENEEIGWGEKYASHVTYIYSH